MDNQNPFYFQRRSIISPGLIYFRKRFLMGLYKGGLIYGWAYTWTIFCVSNKQVRHKQVGHKQGNKRVLSSDYWTYINWGTYIRWAYIRVGLYSGGGAYIRKDVSVSTCGGLIFGGGAYSRRFTVYYSLRVTLDKSNRISSLNPSSKSSRSRRKSTTILLVIIIF